MSSQTALALILVLPFAGAFLISLLQLGLANLNLREKLTRIVSILIPTLSLFITLILFFTFDADSKLTSTLFTWVDIGEFQISITLLLDALFVDDTFYYADINAYFYLCNRLYVR